MNYFLLLCSRITIKMFYGLVLLRKKLIFKTNPCVLLVDDLDNPKNNKKAVGLIKMFIKKVDPIVIDMAKVDK